MRGADLQLTVLVDGAGYFISLDLVGVNRVGANLLRGDAVGLHGVGRRAGGDDYRGSWWRIDHSLVAASFHTDMVGPGQSRGKRYREQANCQRARPLLMSHR